MKRNLLRDQPLLIFWMAIKSFQLIEEKKSSSNQSNPIDFIHDPFGIKGSSAEMKRTGKYNLLLKANVSENQVGLSSNESSRFLITWELIREVNIDGINYLIFTGWGDPMNGGHRQFEGHEIGLEKEMFLELFREQVNNSPDYFSDEKVQNIVGFENVNLNS